MLGHAIRSDRHEHSPLPIDSVRRAGLGADETHDFAHDEAQRLGEVGLGREDVGDRDEELGATHSIFTIRQPDRRTDTDSATDLSIALAKNRRARAMKSAGNRRK